jgi:hypothetical protein
MGVEQHLVGLQQVGPKQKRPAVRELDVGDLELRVLPGKRRPVLAPVELEGLPGLEHERHEDAASGGLLFALARGLPRPCKGRDPVVGALVAESDQIGVKLLQGPPLLAGLARLRFSQADSLSAKGSSLLGRSGTLNAGSTAPDRRYLRIVFRDSPVRLAISRWKNDPAMPSVGSRSVTPCRSLRCPRSSSQGTFEHGSLLSGNLPAARVSSQRKSTRENETLAARAMLETLALDGMLVTGYAMHAQGATAKAYFWDHFSGSRPTGRCRPS